MNQNFEDILNTALTELKKGTPKDEVVLMWPEHKQQLLPYLEIAQQLSTLPKNRIPKPVMRRKYAAAQVKTGVWFAWLHFSRFAGVSMAALLLMSGVSVTAYEAVQSLPGQPLFSLKKSIEQAELRFALNDTQKTNLQMDLAKRRLAEAQTVFSSPDSSPEQQVAALNELNNQTSAVLQTVKSSDNQPSAPLAASLKDITQQQQALLSKIQSDQSKLAANNASPQASAIQQFKQMVAATNEQANVITMAPNPNAVTMTGPIDQINPDFLTIANTSFAINKDTIIKDDTGSILNAPPKAGQQVTVVGIKGSDPGRLTATEITLQTQAAEVAGTSTLNSTLSTSSTTTSSAASLKKTDEPKKPTESTTTLDNSQDQQLQAPSQASTGFIPEDPSPQFAP